MIKFSKPSKSDLKKIATSILVVGVVFITIKTHIIVAVNKSSSLGGKLYLVVKDLSFVRGDTVGLKIHNDPYYKNANFLKMVSGLPGDKITVKDRVYFINGSRVARAKTHNKFGEELKNTSILQDIIPNNKFFLTTKSLDGYDSRYENIGFVPNDRIIGRAIRIF